MWNLADLLGVIFLGWGILDGFSFAETTDGHNPLVG